MQGGQEVEVKLAIENPDAMRQHLIAHGFRPSVDRAFEANTLFDKDDGELKRSRMLLRLRQIGHRTVITWKGPPVEGPHKSRPEVETIVEDYAAMKAILRGLQFGPTFRYEKYRTEFQNPEIPEGVVTLDETPIGNYLELEGAASWIDNTARKLGFAQSSYILDSYGKLYIADCERRGIRPTNMVFSQT